MSHAEYVSRPIPIFTKLAVMLRNFRAVQFVIVNLVALLRSDGATGEPPISRFLDATRIAPGNGVGQPLDLLELTNIATPKLNDEHSEREWLIRRRWAETGIRMWNPNVHGAGFAALGIQGRVELLRPNPGEMLRRYDRLEFELIEGRIVCEGVVVDPPSRGDVSTNAIRSGEGDIATIEDRPLCPVPDSLLVR
jgi:hypothetical protein